MANINEILARAAALRDETALNSIDPERAGSIMYDTLMALNELWLQQGSALVISKIYASVAAMNADTNPVSDLTGQPIRPGMIVVIASSDSDNGSVYRYNGTSSPRWSLVGKIGNLEPVDSLDSDSTQLPLAAHQGKVLAEEIETESNAINTIMGGVLEWLTDKFYSVATGELTDDAQWGYVCSLKYPDTFYQALLDIINWALSIANATQISFWEKGVYAGYRIQNGFHLPDGTSVVSLDFDSFAINVRAIQIADYETKFSIVSLLDIPAEIAEIKDETDDNTQMIDTILNNGKLDWNVGAYYEAQTGNINTSIANYSCSSKYPKHYYPFISAKIEELFSLSTWTQISFWKGGEYVGYRISNGYHKPDRTSVVSLDYDEFAINLSNAYIPDYQISVLFVNKIKTFYRDFYALGDSTTNGNGSSQYPLKGWADYLIELAEFSSFTKLAIGGAFCLYHEGSGRLSAEIDSVPANTTGIVTIMIGTNDFFFDSTLGSASTALSTAYADLDDTTTFANAFRFCLEKLRRKAPNAIIIVMQPLPSYDAGDAHGHIDETNLFAIRDIERTICNAMGIPIIESQNDFGLSRYTDNWNFFYSDFCHPNDVGYQRIAHCMLGKFIEFCQ